jgi:hypothetical protein
VSDTEFLSTIERLADGGLQAVEAERLFRSCKKTITYLFFLCSTIGMDQSDSRLAHSTEPASDDSASPFNLQLGNSPDRLAFEPGAPGFSISREAETNETSGLPPPSDGEERGLPPAPDIP